MHGMSGIAPVSTLNYPSWMRPDASSAARLGDGGGHAPLSGGRISGEAKGIESLSSNRSAAVASDSSCSY